MAKKADADHGEVRPGDELLVYCTDRVREYPKTLAFRVDILKVSEDNVEFEVGDPKLFTYPLQLKSIRDLTAREAIPEVFKKCGVQGFNIARIEGELEDTVLAILENGLPQQSASCGESMEPGGRDDERYTIEDVVQDGCFLKRSALDEILGRLKDKKNVILQGPPGTGKSWLAKRLAFALVGAKSSNRVRPIQFHANLSYEDFVRGWRPSSSGDLQLVDGPFLKAILDANAHPDETFVVVIEEINRGVPAQIFGEMLTLLEYDKRTIDEALPLTYQRSDYERIFIPPNLFVIGTMNVADRSLALVDFALRRRFAFITLKPALGPEWRDWVSDRFSLERSFLDDVERGLNSLNEVIQDDPNLGPGYQIGHSVVTPSSGHEITDAVEWFRQVVRTEIQPLLEEYWFDDRERARDEVNGLLRGVIDG